MLPPPAPARPRPADDRDGPAGTPEAPVARILVSGGARRNRAEQIIAGGRVALATFSLLAVWFDPSEPSRYPAIAYGLLAGYLIYGLLAAGLVFFAAATGRRWALLSHSIDVAMFFTIVFLSAGPNSPFFVSFVFALVSATLRWGWRGTTYTTAILLPLYLVLGWLWVAELDFDLGRFVTRAGYLAVVAALLAYLGAHEGQLRTDVVRLLRQPSGFSVRLPKVIAEVLNQAAELFHAPRTLLLWEEDEEPWLRSCAWSPDGILFDKDSPSAFEPPVAAVLEHLSFSCRSLHAAEPVTTARTALAVSRFRGTAIHPALLRRFPMRSVLSAPVSAPGFRGRLFVIDPPRSSIDDLVLCELFVRQMSAHLAHVDLVRRMQRGAEADVRAQLGRELHDGVVQSLTAAALRLAVGKRMLAADSPIRAVLSEVEEMLGAEQEELRTFIRDYRPRSGVHSTVTVPLAERLDELRRRIASHWGLSVEMSCASEIGTMIGPLAHEIYRITQEALINSARHGEASQARVDIRGSSAAVRLVIADDGQGFAFRGRHDLADLNARKAGPLMLKQRVTSLAGQLTIDSSAAGARLEIELPWAIEED
jgi:signal transduction histidine kinase